MTTAAEVDDAPASARAILRLAVPALGALAAEPLYVLADTAIVGHLGTPQLGGLGVASTILLTGYTVFIFLAYGTTGAVARRMGAGDERGATHLAVQGLWLAAGLALVSAAVLWVLGPPLIDLLGADHEVAGHARVYLRISLLGLPGLLVTMAGTGYLRGIQDARTPLVVAVSTSIANIAIQVVLIEGFDRGIGASALSTVVAQTAGAAVYLAKVVGGARRTGAGLRPDRVALRRLATIGRDLLIRTAALRLALGGGTVVAARLGVVPLAAHQVAFEVLTFLSLSLDALAIAGQSLVGTDLGAGAAARARATGRRILVWAAGAGIVTGVAITAVRHPLAGVFTDDGAVEALSADLLLWVALFQVPAGVVYALDGILIGAGDLRFLARASVGVTAVFLPCAVAVAVTDAGIGWLWAALGLMFLTRLVPLLRRFQRGAWAVLGADHP
ncbi:MATE family efflux transporter [Iamia sp. SCSIO 61187]|uniref:MATE family efflux transporter n=1 Tax=Iamia sp. SCSIO 61187 TaxID=2722752 RepID=UPI001C629756|nr:MATE family efflux transporter [Iamia sp. SCSIO 61187]QYG94549.1 MATE family efflux transporter [Iamia sp. SCSIO 61187]